MEIQLSHCGRMCLGLPEVELRGLLRHATRRRTAARHMEAATHTLWAQVPLCFSLLIALPNAVAADVATATDDERSLCRRYRRLGRMRRRCPSGCDGNPAGG